MATEYLVKDLSEVCSEWTSEWDSFEEAACDMAEEWFHRCRRKGGIVTAEVLNMDTGECRIIKVEVTASVKQTVVSNERKWG